MMHRLLLAIAIVLVMTAHVAGANAASYKPLCSGGFVVDGKCREAKDLEKQCKDAQCRALIRARLDLLERYRRTARPSPEKERLASANLLNSVASTQKELAKYGTPAKTALCRQRRTGQIVCLETKYLLALYDPKIARAVLADLVTLKRLAKLDDKKNTLIACAGDDGPYVDMNIPFSSASDLRSKANAQASLISKLCGAAKGMNTGDGGGGFSGITGIGARDLNPANCSFGLNTDSQAKVIDDMLKASMAMHECYQSSDPVTQKVPISDTMMADAAGSSSGGSNTDVKILTDSSGNATGVEYKDGNTGETVRIDFTDDGPQVSSTSADGKTSVSTAPDGSSTATVDVGQGRTDTHHFDSSGNYQGHDEQLRAKNGDTETTITKHFNANGNLTSVSRSDRNTRTGDYQHRNNGTFISGDGYHHDVWKKGADGQWHRQSGGPISCVDEAMCSRCKGAEKAYREALGQCLDFGSRSAPCNAYRGSSSCCSTNNMFVDPRLVMPNPMGDLVCTGSAENAAVKKQACERQCQVAKDMDCTSLCAESERPAFEWSLLDRACLYMYSEECFGTSSEGNLSFLQGTTSKALEASQRFMLVPLVVPGGH